MSGETIRREEVDTTTGKTRFYQTTKLPLRREDGTIYALCGISTDISELKAHEEQLKHIAHYDALTTLPNRVLLADRLQQAMTHRPAARPAAAVAYLDLDGFKTINDQHGHKMGDQLLIALANAMKDRLREGDTLARLGGDEFIAVLIDLDSVAGSLPMLTWLLAAAAQPVRIGDSVLQVSASLGVTFIRRPTTSTPTSRCARPTRRCPGQTGRQEPLPRVRRRSGPQRARLPREPRTHPPRAHRTGVRAAPPAQGQHAHRPGHRRRGADPLAAPGARHARAVRLPAGDRGSSARRRYRRLVIETALTQTERWRPWA